MKLSDFTFEKFIDDSGKEDIWENGSKSDKRGVGSIGGKRYQIKVHQKEPIWKNTAQKISALEAQMRASDDDDMKADLQNQINTLKAKKSRYDAADKVADDYVAIKKNLIKELQAIGDPLIVAPVDFWKQEVEFKGNAMCTVEATPWFENTAVWFEKDKPLVFNRDLDKTQQYKIVASLAERVEKLHNRGIIHGDLKMGNTLITKEGSEFKAVLIDFDGSIVLNDLYSDKYAFGAWNFVVGGTYYAPETYDLNEYVKDEDNEDFGDFDVKSVDQKSDIFGLGITIYEYFFGRADMTDLVPFVSADGSEKLTNMNYAKYMKQGYKLDLPSSMDDFLYGMFNWMLAYKPSDRPTAAQVKEAFLTQDLSKAPSWCVRNPLWEEHRDDYEMLDVPGVSIQRTGKNRYLLRRNGTIKSYSIDELVDVAKVAKRLKEVAAPAPKIDESGKAWPSDGGGDLPSCVRRAGTDGRYMQNSGGIMRGVSYKDLVSSGIICSEAEKLKPWPCDSDLTYISTRKISRDFGYKRGPGCYLVGDGVAAIPYTRKTLIESGLASVGLEFKLHPGDAELYVPSPEKVPSTVKNILRSMMNHQYRIIYNDGREEKLGIADMLAKGYVKKK